MPSPTVVVDSRLNQSMKPAIPGVFPISEEKRRMVRVFIPSTQWPPVVDLLLPKLGDRTRHSHNDPSLVTLSNRLSKCVPFLVLLDAKFACFQDAVRSGDKLVEPLDVKNSNSFTRRAS